ncbi:MAG: lytic transglycosylase domain-containing protein [bacterium]
MTKNIDKITPINSMFVKGLVLVVIVISIVAFYYKLFWISPEQKNSKLVDLEKTLQDIRAAMNVDSVRQYNIQKVMKIISKYNKDMPSSMKYEISEEIYNMSVKYTNLDVDLLCATITQESGGTWNPEIVSEAGAMGLMQIMPTTGLWIAYYENITWTSAKEILFNPIYNIRIGSRNLSALINQYNLEGGLAAYNGGEKRAAIWLLNNKAKGILWTETSNYIPHVLLLYKEFKTFTL